jgi:hypothetical protein
VARSEAGKRALDVIRIETTARKVGIESASPRCSVEICQCRRPSAYGFVQDRRDIDGVLGHDVLECRSRRLSIHTASRELTLHARRCGAPSGQPSPRELACVGAIVEQANVDEAEDGGVDCGRWVQSPGKPLTKLSHRAGAPLEHPKCILIGIDAGFAAARGYCKSV